MPPSVAGSDGAGESASRSPVPRVSTETTPLLVSSGTSNDVTASAPARSARLATSTDQRRDAPSTLAAKSRVRSSDDHDGLSRTPRRLTSTVAAPEAGSSNTMLMAPPRSQRTAAMRVPSCDQRGALNVVSRLAPVSGVTTPASETRTTRVLPATFCTATMAPSVARASGAKRRAPWVSACSVPSFSRTHKSLRMRQGSSYSICAKITRPSRSSTLGSSELRRATRRGAPLRLAGSSYSPATSRPFEATKSRRPSGATRGKRVSHDARVSPCASPLGPWLTAVITESRHVFHCSLKRTPKARFASPSKAHGSSRPDERSTNLSTPPGVRSLMLCTKSDPNTYALVPPGKSSVATDHSPSRGSAPSSALAFTYCWCAIPSRRPPSPSLLS